MKYSVGKPAAPFELPDINGVTHGLDDIAGNWTLLVFLRHLG